MHPTLLKLKHQNPRRFESLCRAAHVYEDDTPFAMCWSVVLSDDKGHSWIETNFSTKEAAEHRKQIFTKGY